MQVRRADNTACPAAIYLTALCDANDRNIGHSISVIDLSGLQGMPGMRSGMSPGIYDHAPGFIAISSGKHHRIEYANASYRDLVKCDDLVGKTFAEALPELAEQGLVAMLDEVYRTGEPYCVTDLPVAIPDPATGGLKQCWIDVVNQPLKDDTGAITGLFCEGYNVTDRHEMNQALAELELKMIHLSRVNAMGTMAATLAHELNQPLTAISNYLAGVRAAGENPPDPIRLMTALRGIDEAARRALAIVNHVRQLTRRRKPGREPFNLKEAVDECMQLLRSSCRPAIAFDNRVAGDVIVAADRVKVQQVLINLIQNAYEAMADGKHGQVAITALSDDRSITVAVADSGPGVSPEAIRTMFSWTESAKDDGMGIGLSISRTIVELYGGRIWLERTGPDGSEFRFSLPRPAASMAAPPS